MGGSLAELGRRATARFYLQSVVFPAIEEIARQERTTLVEKMTKMIRSGETIGTYAQRPEYRRRLDETIGSPAACFLLDRFSHHLGKPDHEVRASVPWWINRIREIRPELCSIIVSEPRGEEWLGDNFIDLLRICREYTAPGRP